MKTKRLFHNWQLKLGAGAIAILVWLMIMSFSDPPDTRTITNVPVTIINDEIFSEAGKSYTVDGRLTTAVRVTGSTSAVRNLNASDFTATADLSKMYDVTGQVPITLTCSARNASTLTYAPTTASLKINIEDVLSKNYSLIINPEGSAAEGYLLGQITLNPSYITVRAPESVIERIAEAVVTVDIEGLSENTTLSCTPHYYSAAGTELTFEDAKDTTFSTNEVKADVEIRTIKTVPVVIAVGGQDAVASGYRYTGAQQSLSTIRVSGLRSRLAEINSITIPETVLSVAGASADIETEIDLTDYLPEGISLVSGEEETLTVTLLVEPLIVKTYEVNKITLIGEKENYEYIIRNMPLQVQLRALEEDFKEISDEHITATLDVSAYSAGDYSLSVNIELDSVFELFSNAKANISIRELEETTAVEDSE